ncbi:MULTISPECIES: DNA cytosine methyltransferase [unclassified Kribbella]|uniref:DNA cytosine methyltransferase n=1 Tax=unclassified Kribbella TaxID=2644121 RepID=UPI0030182016
MSTSKEYYREKQSLQTQRLSSIDVCAGAGGLALGLEQAGFDPVLLLDNHPMPCGTLRANRPEWDVRQIDLLDFDPSQHQQTYDVDLLSAGLPRVKAAATVARARGSESELQLLKGTAFLVHAVQPRAVIIENLAELVTNDDYAPIRSLMEDELTHLGYQVRWFVLNAADYGVPQVRKHGILVALKGDSMDAFELPRADACTRTVGDALGASMASRGWAGAGEWAAQADELAPTLVGGSWERGGADLGPSGTKNVWARMRVNGGSIADDVPGPDFAWNPNAERSDMVKLTVAQAALLQGFPPDWKLAGKKTAQYRQIGNATPPPVARALGVAVRAALLAC